VRNFLLFLRPLTISLIGLLLANCNTDSQNTTTPAASTLAASTPAASSGFASVPAPGDPEAEITSNDYRIAPRDLLQVSVFQVPDLNRTVQVNGSGFVVLPLVGNVQVAGKTTDQAQQEIAAKLGKTYLRSPQVSVSIAKSGQRVTVNGAVKSPQVMTIESRLTLSQAVATAGGLSEVGNAQRVHVARAVDQVVNDGVFDLEAIQAGKAADPSLVGGDIVVVEESGGKVAFKNVKDLLPFAVLGTLMSDIRVKRDIVPVGHLPNGLRLYRYRYVWSSTLYVGVIAQEVMEVVPAAVTRGRDGYLRVDYRRLGLSLQTWDEWVASNPTEFNRWTINADLRPTGDGMNMP
jgi:polysaccharide export outer membrane protein